MASRMHPVGSSTNCGPLHVARTCTCAASSLYGAWHCSLANTRCLMNAASKKCAPVAVAAAVTCTSRLYTFGTRLRRPGILVLAVDSLCCSRTACSPVPSPSPLLEVLQHHMQHPYCHMHDTIIKHGCTSKLVPELAASGASASPRERVCLKQTPLLECVSCLDIEIIKKNIASYRSLYVETLRPRREMSLAKLS